MVTRRRADDRMALLQGTLDLLILRTLRSGPEHGQGIARAIQHQSKDVLLVDHGSLYPALQRLEAKGLVSAEWGVSDNNRRARFYSITGPGRKEVGRGTTVWRRFTAAVGHILDPDPARG
jgi:transcriptional regulator